MKKQCSRYVFLVVGLLGGLITLTSTSQAVDMDYDLYFRTPVATNGAGGKQITLSNPGSQGNEFRLGNETGYGEATFTAHSLKNKLKTEPYFDAVLTFAYDPSMNSQYSDTNTGTDNVQLVQVYAKGGNLDQQRFSYWAGKRFYRDAGIYMNDFFYFADMSGNGGGLEDIPLSNGSLSVALLQYSDRSVSATTHGLPTKQALDLRWKDYTFLTNEKLTFWLAQARTSPGSGTVGATLIDYQAESGTAIGARWTHDMGQDSNNLALVYGTGVMESLTLNNTAYVLPTSNQAKKNRLRLVDVYKADFGPKWSLQAAAVIEQADNGASSSSKSRWYSVGVRPLYYFTDNFHLASGLGYSIVNNESETSTSGKVGDRTLMRLTIAPEMALGKGFYTRPVVRAFVTYSQWNDANKDTTNSKSLLGALSSSTKAFENKNDALQFGVESEIWF